MCNPCSHGMAQHRLTMEEMTSRLEGSHIMLKQEQNCSWQEMGFWIHDWV